MIEYRIEPDLDTDEFLEVLRRSTLADRRPVDDIWRIRAMLAGASLIVTARDAGVLVGLARSITDGVYCTYLSDLAVDERYQRRGIGRELIRRTKEAAPEALLILLSAPKAVDYYPRIGMTRHDHCYLLDDINRLI